MAACSRRRSDALLPVFGSARASSSRLSSTTIIFIRSLCTAAARQQLELVDKPRDQAQERRHRPVGWYKRNERSSEKKCSHWSEPMSHGAKGLSGNLCAGSPGHSRHLNHYTPT